MDFKEFPATFWLNESCVLRPGRPFYIPEWDEEFRLFPMLALRVSKVGKGIPARFAYRYIREASVWLHARGMNTLTALQSRGLPLASALAYDSSLISAPWAELPLESAASLACTISVGDHSTELRLPPELDPAAIFACLATRNTMRTGDIILLPLDGDSLPIAPGDRVEVSISHPISQQLTSLLIK